MKLQMRPPDHGLNWMPSATLKPSKVPPGTVYGLALVKGGDVVGMTHRGEIHWGVVAGHFRHPFKRVMAFREFMKLVYPCVEEERMDAYRHASKLDAGYARGYLLECHDCNQNMMARIAERLDQFPYERVRFITEASFNDPLEEKSTVANCLGPKAVVIEIAVWLNENPGKALWHKAVVTA